MDARIGKLANGEFYAYPNGLDAPEVRGTLIEVETALELTLTLEAAKNADDTGGATIEVGSYVVMHTQSWLIQQAAPTWDQARSDLDQLCEELEMTADMFQIMHVTE